MAATSAQGEIYLWKDSRGTRHYTNSAYEIPARYRAGAKVLDTGQEQKAGQPGQQSEPPVPGTAPVSPGLASQVPAVPSLSPGVVAPEQRPPGESRRRSLKRSQLRGHIVDGDRE